MASILDGVDMRTQLAGHNRLELLLFRLSGRQRFGINVFKVQEIIQCPQLTKIPGSNPVVRGIANMRGHTITVMDLAQCIGMLPLPELETRSVIITEYNRRVQGFLVGSVDRIVNMNWQEIMTPPKGADVGTYMTAVTQVDDDLVEIIDVEKILKEVMGGSEEVSQGVVQQDAARQQQHVLVVDDSAVARKQVQRVLEQVGVEMTVKKNGLEALAQLQEWAGKPGRLSDWLALIISDVEMPRMDGYTLTTHVRSDPALQDLHVILHTSLSGVFNQSMIEKVGANLFLAKFDPDLLAKVVQERLTVHKAERIETAREPV